jgi:hypothetical protein
MVASKGKTPAQRRTAKATKLGYGGDVGAMKATTRQYGLVKNAEGNFVRPDAAFLDRQMAASGWLNQPVQTPVNIGGMRFNVGEGVATPTGMRSDAAKQNPGGSYLDPSGKYIAAGVNAKGGHDKHMTAAERANGRGGKGKPKGKPRGHKPKSGGVGDGPTADEKKAVGYAEADTTTTSMLRAQGKAYAAGRSGASGSRRGQDSAPVEESQAEEAGGKRKRPRKHRNRHVVKRGKRRPGHGKK